MRSDPAPDPRCEASDTSSKSRREPTRLPAVKPLLDWQGWLALGWCGWFGVRYLGMILDERAPAVARALGRMIGGG